MSLMMSSKQRLWLTKSSGNEETLCGQRPLLLDLSGLFNRNFFLRVSLFRPLIWKENWLQLLSFKIGNVVIQLLVSLSDDRKDIKRDLKIHDGSSIRCASLSGIE